jgi:hypothetical protein
MEEFIFDDDVDEVGAEVEAHCPKCRTDTAHVVVSKYEDEIRRVQCNPCGDVHPYRKPRGESGEETEEPAPKKKAQKAKPTWEQVMAKSKKQPRAYAIGEFFKEMEILSHPKFGVGYVTENIGDDKIEVTFQSDKRVLVHNRKGMNLPFSMLRQFNLPGQRGQKQKKGKADKAERPAKNSQKPAPKAKVANVQAKAAPQKKAPAPKGRALKPKVGKAVKRAASIQKVAQKSAKAKAKPGAKPPRREKKKLKTR